MQNNCMATLMRQKEIVSMNSLFEDVASYDLKGYSQNNNAIRKYLKIRNTRSKR